MRSTADTATGAWDVVGRRVLVGVQMVDISRLSAHPVPITTGGLITVAGQGPKDSNGAGKSSFIAALSLLHADEQWRLAGGAPGAAELLFTAELAAQDGRWANADHGYVIGVFADPQAAAAIPAEHDPDDAEAITQARAAAVQALHDSALTVWLRINRSSPYLCLRWAHGVHVPQGSSDAERAAQVDKLWQALPSSNGRDDFHAGRLAGVLYGNHVRCVSFLSTSVRASPAANLLAQPLNELSPARIFEAIATLTGLDRELESEQSLRSAEHRHRAAAAEAEQELARWQKEADVVEGGIRRRAAARDKLEVARAAWRSRCARHLLDGLDDEQRLAEERDRLHAQREELRERVESAREAAEDLADDEEFERRFRTAEAAWTAAQAADQEADTQHRLAIGKLEDLGRRLRELTEAAAAADGRTPEQARRERDVARESVDVLLAEAGAARAAQERAQRRLAETESGRGAAAEQLAALAAEDIPAAGVADVLVVPEDARDLWEPRLHPFRDAVVVAPEDVESALVALAGLPGSVLVVADDPNGLPPPGALRGTVHLPGVADDRFGLQRFLFALAARAGAGSMGTVATGAADGAAGVAPVDSPAGVHVVGGFPMPVTGRVARVAAARTAAERAADVVRQIDQAIAASRVKLSVAEDRLTASLAAASAEGIAAEVDALRESAARLEAARDLGRPALDEAHRTYTDALGDRKARQDKVTGLRQAAQRAESELSQVERALLAVEDKRAALDLQARLHDWGGTSDAAREHVLSLPKAEQERATSAWDAECAHLADDVLRRCFGDDAPAEQLPAQLREVVVTGRWRTAGLEARLVLLPELLRALRTHLDLSARQDAHDSEQIERQRAQRTADLQAASDGLREAEEITRAHRATLGQAIQAKLRRVAEEFDRLDREYGGYGAGLDVPEPEPPTDPDKPWRWTVTPKWRRAEGQRLSAYTLRGNTAQMDEKAVKLVCSAALAGNADRPLLLILDELGRNLGKQHRREAVALFERIGRDRDITVIGALQDDMERYALEASMLYVKLRRSSDAVAYNDAPIVVGHESNRARVDLLADWLATARPDADVRGERAASGSIGVPLQAQGDLLDVDAVTEEPVAP
ncbi:MAG: hypothetical protein U0Q15_20005 [Kineosporiaceae bacterium]